MVDQARHMVSDGINHPSIILWAFLNESASDHPTAVPVYREISQAIRELDPTRLVTWASHRYERDLCWEFADVVSLNFYPGWIHPTGDWSTPNLSLIAPYLAEKADYCAPGAGGKPLLVSEIGACGLIHGAMIAPALNGRRSFRRTTLTRHAGRFWRSRATRVWHSGNSATRALT